MQQFIVSLETNSWTQYIPHSKKNLSNTLYSISQVEKKVGNCLYINWKWNPTRTSQPKKIEKKASPKLSLSYILSASSSNPTNPIKEFASAMLLNASNM